MSILILYRNTSLIHFQKYNNSVDNTNLNISLADAMLKQSVQINLDFFGQYLPYSKIMYVLVVANSTVYIQQGLSSKYSGDLTSTTIKLAQKQTSYDSPLTERKFADVTTQTYTAENNSNFTLEHYNHRMINTRHTCGAT